MRRLYTAGILLILALSLWQLQDPVEAGGDSCCTDRSVMVNSATGALKYLESHARWLESQGEEEPEKVKQARLGLRSALEIVEPSKR